MKIGTLTYWNTEENYGQVMQSFALVKYLSNLGYDASLIRYIKRPERESSFHKFFRWLKIVSPKRIKAAMEYRKFHKIMAANQKQHPRYFDLFRDEYLPMTPQIYDQQSIFSDTPQFDAYICGSDQIWGEADAVFMLQFAPKDALRLSYAASMGGAQLKGDEKAKFSDYLSTFNFVSLREQEAVDFCKQLGRNDAVLVPDPTLLLDREEYTALYRESNPSNPSKHSKGYILLYLLGNKIGVDVDEIYAYAEQRNLEVIYVASQGRTDSHEKNFPTIQEWLSLIDNATCVFTNSFHGTVFCLLFNTPFLTLPVTGVFSRMNVRIQGLLKHYSMEGRILHHDLTEADSPCDFSMFNRQRVEDELYVKQLLRRALHSDM